MENLKTSQTILNENSFFQFDCVQDISPYWKYSVANNA